MNRIFLLSAIVTISLTFSLSAFGQASQTAVPALRVEPDPASTGRGFTGVALADNASAVYWNPALLANNTNTQIGISRFKWLPNLDGDLNYNYITGRHHVDNIGTFGGHITYLDLGSQDFRDDRGNSNGMFSSYELAVGLSLGRVAIADKLTLGLGVRFISSRLAPSGSIVGVSETQTGNSFGVDLGTHYTPQAGPLFGTDIEPSLGVAITNFGGRVNYSNSGFKTSIPSLFRLGVANKFILDEAEINTVTASIEMSKFLVRSDSTGAEPAFKSLFTSWGSYEYFNGHTFESVPLSKQLMFGYGLEYWYNGMFALRSGYYNQSVENGGRSFITVGAGIKYDFIQVDMSYAMPQRNEVTGDIVRFGLSVNL